MPSVHDALSDIAADVLQLAHGETHRVWYQSSKDSEAIQVTSAIVGSTAGGNDYNAQGNLTQKLRRSVTIKTSFFISRGVTGIETGAFFYIAEPGEIAEPKKSNLWTIDLEASDWGASQVKFGLIRNTLSHLSSKRAKS